MIAFDMKKIYWNVIFLFSTLVQSLESSACPAPCKCTLEKLGQNVNCQSKKLNTIPDGIPNNAVKLDLSGNNIAKIDDSSFSSLSLLIDLKLSNNKIETISLTAFDGLANLQNLYMVHCGLSNWSAELLSPMKKLAALYLTDNDFKIIPNITSPLLSRLFLDKNKFMSLKFPDNFKLNLNLQSLVLSNNNISQIEDDDFAALKDLPIISLKLSECKIKNISSKALSNLAQLKTLDLNSNGLASAQLDLFLSQISSKLETLSINKNNIESLGARTFAKFTNSCLSILQVDGNPLNLIDPEAFAPLTKLTRLSLRNCKFSSIENALQPLKTLTHLMLSNNQLSKVPNFLPTTLQYLQMSTTQLPVLPSYVFANVRNLNELFITNSSLETIESEAFLLVESSKIVVDFSDNPFKCDCSLAWFRNWINRTSVTVKNVENYLCGSPEPLKGRMLLSFSVANCSSQITTLPSFAPNSQLTTHQSQSTLSVTVIISIAIVCVVVTVVLFVIAVVLIRRNLDKRNRLNIRCHENNEDLF